MRISTLFGGLLALATSVAAADKLVFAHYMNGQPGATIWAESIAAAQAAGIDAFAINAQNADWSLGAIQDAYTAAATANFKMFISFDMGATTYDTGTVIDWINTVKGMEAQLLVDGKPFVSTYQGCDFATSGSWGTVEASTGDLYIVPSFTFCGDTDAVTSSLASIDGAFNWQAWPVSGPGPMTTDGDQAYISALAGKAYMMPVSPWMFTHTDSKNWLLGSDTLWYDRWEQVITVQPQFVEIITWNDYGESHYIGGLDEGTIGDDQHDFVDGIPHTAWQQALPYYIAAYKAGTKDGISIPNEGAVFWYRETPKNIDGCTDGGTECASNSGVSAIDCVEDNVYVMTMSNTATTVTVGIGGTTQDFNVDAGTQLVQMPFNGNLGDVTVSINGKTGNGSIPINTTCPPGWINFNPVVGSAM